MATRVAAAGRESVPCLVLAMPKNAQKCQHIGIPSAIGAGETAILKTHGKTKINQTHTEFKCVRA